ncbi:high frequency lysogenization protein HflD [Kitasatospora sp. NPDC059571]|uniref:high frequency lysogenization protein HflD n=1 Tax=Kitasatospora sp. NPDC059571 TaxID=3346871 RepID=UPI0036BCE92A
MRARRLLILAATATAGVLWPLLAAAPPAAAHPLGNFSLNHYLGLTLSPDRVEALAVTDTAEIPTLQEQTQIDRNGDGAVDDTERADWARRQCDDAAHRLQVRTTSGSVLGWSVTSSSFTYQPGAAGLRTGRLECHLRAPVRLPEDGADFEVTSGFDATRVGWNEITARGDRVALDHTDVPDTSVSHELRDYPRDLLSSPSGVTTARFHATPGAPAGPAATGDAARTAGAGPTAWLASLDGELTRLGAARRLTLPLGLLAVLLATVLGAGHALLPGHGKTVMAAYLAGRRGRTRDAVTVGATVTATHTAGVLLTGLCLTAFSSLAGDVLLGWLGVVSGVLVILVGAGLLRDVARRRRTPTAVPGVRTTAGLAPAPALAGPTALTRGPEHHHHHDRGHPDGHHDHQVHHVHEAAADHHHHDVQDHDHDHDDVHGTHHDHPHHDHDHPHHDHDHPHHDHDHPHHDHHHHRHGLFGGHRHGPRAAGRRSLIGLGIAGGLVPSPSALVVLLGAVALGRTLFGAGLVIAYGLGMAATLTATGLLLVKLGDRLDRAAGGTLVGRLRRLAPYSALLTALLVLTVGAGLVLRSLPATL